MRYRRYKANNEWSHSFHITDSPMGDCYFGDRITPYGICTYIISRDSIYLNFVFDGYLHHRKIDFFTVPMSRSLARHINKFINDVISGNS